MVIPTAQGAAASAAPVRGGRNILCAEDTAERERRGCEVCGEWFPGLVLEWHHVEPHRKRGNPCRLGNRALMRAEWLKCIVVCPTCHKIADYERDRA